MQNIKYIIIAMTSVVLMNHAHAGTSTGKVTMMLVNASNYLFFTAGTKTGSPGCGNNNQWAINLGTPKGKSIYALLLSAQMQDKSVTVYGNNTCNEWGDREDVLYGVAN